MLKKKTKIVPRKVITYSVDLYRSINTYTNISPLGYELFTSDDVPNIEESKKIIELIGKRRGFNNNKYEIKYYNNYGRSVIYYEVVKNSGETVTCVVFFNNLHQVSEKFV